MKLFDKLSMFINEDVVVDLNAEDISFVEYLTQQKYSCIQMLIAISAKAELHAQQHEMLYDQAYSNDIGYIPIPSDYRDMATTKPIIQQHTDWLIDDYIEELGGVSFHESQIISSNTRLCLINPELNTDQLITIVTSYLETYKNQLIVLPKQQAQDLKQAIIQYDYDRLIKFSEQQLIDSATQKQAYVIKNRVPVSNHKICNDFNIIVTGESEPQL